MHNVGKLACVVALTVVVAGCGKSGKDRERTVPQQPDLSILKKPEEPKSEFHEMRDAVEDFSALLKKCDANFFSDVKGERIKKWQLPVDVQRMEDLCDPLLSMFEKIVETGAFLCPEMDEYIGKAARAADQYLILAFRSKKVGVREKKPYIRRVNALRDGLRAAVKEAVARGDHILGLPDGSFKANASTAPGDIPALTNEVLSGLEEVVETYVVKPIKKERPTWRYSLRSADRIAGRAVEMLRRKTPTDKLALAGPADALGREFKATVNFFTGAWYNEEEGMDRKVLKSFRRAAKAYRKAAVRALKLL